MLPGVPPSVYYTTTKCHLTLKDNSTEMGKPRLNCNQRPYILSAHLLCSDLKWASLFTDVLLGCNGWRAVIPSICSAVMTKHQLAAELHYYMK